MAYRGKANALVPSKELAAEEVGISGSTEVARGQELDQDRKCHLALLAPCCHLIGCHVGRVAH